MLSLRGAGGLGDAIYMYPVLKYFLENGVKVEILTKYPDVYTSLLKKGLIVTDRYAKQPDRECRYSPRYSNKETTTYQDTLILSKVGEYLPFEMEYECENEFVFKTNKKICIVRMPVYPMKGKPLCETLIPDCKIFQKIIDRYKDECYFVLAGNSTNFKFELTGIDLDLTNKLKIPEVFQLINQSDIALTQCGFFIPIAETLNKKLFVVFAREAMAKPKSFFHHITPKKVINKTDIVWTCIDDDDQKSILDRFGELLKLEVSK